MGSRPLPPRPKAHPCHACGGKYSLDYDAQGVPTAYHTLPYCTAFEAVETSVDAVVFLERCQESVSKTEREKFARLK